MLYEMPETTQVEITPVHTLHPLDAVLNQLTGANNARAIITWLAEHEDDDEQLAGSARHTAIKGL
jgi:hypothetical protein